MGWVVGVIYVFEKDDIYISMTELVAVEYQIGGW